MRDRRGAQAHVFATTGSAFLFAAIISVTSTGIAYATSGTVFTIDWAPRPDQPDKIMIDDLTRRIELNTSGARFSGTYSYPTTTGKPTNATVTARFSDGAELVLPVRFRPGLDVMATIYRAHIQTCSRAELGPIDRATGVLDKALRSYFTALEAIQLAGDDQCGPEMKKFVTKAWFDRSYELVTIKSYFRLSGEAANAYAQYDPNYVGTYFKQDQGAEFKLANDWKIQLKKNSDFSGALKINNTLRDELASHPDLESSVKTVQAYRLQQLDRDAIALGFAH